MRAVIVDPASVTPVYDAALGTALVAAGCDVEVLTAPFVHGRLPPSGLAWRHSFGWLAGRLGGRRRRPLRQAARLFEYSFDWLLALRRIRLTEPDVVHIQWAPLPLFDVLAFRAIRRLGPRLVFTVHDVRPQERWRQRWLSTDPLLDLPDDLIVHTRADRRALQALSRPPSGPVHVVPHGTLGDPSALRAERAAARAALGLPAEVPLALFFGAIKAFKGLDRLLAAFARVAAQLPLARLLIAGYPTEPFEPYARAMVALGLSERVECRLGFVPEPAATLCFRAADLIVLPYLRTSFSGVLMMALTAGRATVVSDVGGLSEAVEPGVSGLLVPPDAVGALSAAVLELLADRARADRFGQRAATLAATNHAWPAIAAATLAVYRRTGR